jgi:hypothetical protein
MNGLKQLKRNKMKQFLASAIVNSNEIRLIKERNGYFIYWGEESKTKAIQEILTPSGRKPCQATAHKRFLEAVESTQYLKFSKL